MLTLDKIYHAAFVLKDVARKTDLIEAPKLSKDCQLYLKTENLTLVLKFDKLEHFRCFSGHRGAGPSRDGFHYCSSAYQKPFYGRN